MSQDEWGNTTLPKVPNSEPCWEPWGKRGPASSAANGLRSPASLRDLDTNTACTLTTPQTTISEESGEAELVRLILKASTHFRFESGQQTERCLPNGEDTAQDWM